MLRCKAIQKLRVYEAKKIRIEEAKTLTIPFLKLKIRCSEHRI